MIVSRTPALAIALLAGATFCAGPASAQVDHDIQVGSKIPVRPEKPDPIRDGLVRDRYVLCSYGPHREQIDRLLHNSDPLTADFEKAGINTRKMFRDHTLRECFTAEGAEVQASIAFSPTAFRYLMLEAAYRRKVPELPANYSEIVAPPRTFVTSGEQLTVARSLAALGDCVAAQDPVGADRLLRTASGTPSERAAATALVPALGSCIVQGQQVQLTPANIRAFAADGMWQRFVASVAD